MSDDGSGRWSIRLAAAAESDFRSILRWTRTQFRNAQARTYSVTLSRALEALTEGPLVVGARHRNEIGEGLMTLHVARGGRKGRHFVLYRAGSRTEAPVIEVLRLLHDSMDLPRHFDPEGSEAG